jgi:hypothetical protein
LHTCQGGFGHAHAASAITRKQRIVTRLGALAAGNDAERNVRGSTYLPTSSMKTSASWLFAVQQKSGKT